MNTFYSIVYALITPQTGEKIALGLLLSDEEKSVFRYSKAKLAVVHALVKDEQSKFIADYLHSLDRQCNTPGAGIPALGLEFAGAKSLVSESYIDYLSVYNQNIITYSKPVVIDMEVSTHSMDILFHKLINEKESAVLISPHEHKLALIKFEFILKVGNYYSIDREITNEAYSNLIMPVRIDLFGKNEWPVFAKFFDFERKVPAIKNDYFDLNQLVEVLENPKGFIISSEPEIAKYPIQHKAWESIRNSNKTEYLDSSEVDKIQDYAVEHGVIPS